MGVGSPGHQRAILCVEPQEETDLSPAQIQNDLLKQAQSLTMTREIKHVVVTGPFPVDIRHNAKIQREALATLIGRHLS